MAKSAKKQRIKQRKGNPQNVIGKGFDNRPENINRKGRPRKLLNEVCQELISMGYRPVSETQIIEAYNLLLQLPEAEIKRIQADKDKPYYLRRVAEMMKSNRFMEMMDRILDRSFGKVLQRQMIDANIKTEQPFFPDVAVKNNIQADSDGND